MKYLLFIVLCLSTVLLGGCGLLYWYVAGDRGYSTECVVDDSETNRQEVMQLVRLIADHYGFQDRTEEDKSRDEQHGSGSLKAAGYTIIAHYQVSGSGKPSNDITLTVSSQQGELSTFLSHVKQGKATPKYIEIGDRLVSDFKGRYGEEVDVRVSWRRL